MAPRGPSERHDLLASLNGPARRLVEQRGIDRRYKIGERLFHRGGETTALFIVLEGRVRVIREVNGRSQSVHEEGPGGTLGDVALFSGQDYPASAIAIEPTRCLILPLPIIDGAMALDPAMGRELLRRLALRVRTLIDRVDGLVFGTVRSRLAQFLIERRCSGVGSTVVLGMTQARLAEELGTVREVIVKVLRGLGQDEVVRLGPRGRIVILDAARLQQIAVGERAGEPVSARARRQPREPAPHDGGRDGRRVSSRR